MTDPFHGAMDLTERRDADRRISETRKEARRDYIRYSEEQAQAEHNYKVAKAKALTKFRLEGKGVGEAEILAEAEAADYKLRRDLAASLAKAALLRVDEAERDATVVRDLHKSSERAEGLAA